MGNDYRLVFSLLCHVCKRRDEAEICFSLCHHLCATLGGNGENFQWEREWQERIKSQLQWKELETFHLF